MKKLEMVDKFLFKDENILCSAYQSIRILKWLITNLVIMIIVLGGLGVFLFAIDISEAVTNFLESNSWVNYIYFGIAGVWIVIFAIMLVFKLNKFKPHIAVLTDKRVFIIQGTSATTLFFDSITGTTMKISEDEEYAGKASIEIHTNAKIYDMSGMKGGNKLINTLLRLKFGQAVTVEVTSSKKREEKSIVEEVKNVAPTPKPVPAPTPIKTEPKVETKTSETKAVEPDKVKKGPFGRPLKPQSEEQKSPTDKLIEKKIESNK